MSKVILVIDESGAKGYSDRPETAVGEFGVMVGYLVPEEHANEVRNRFRQIQSKYTSDGKLHITDLQPKAQEGLRVDIFREFSELGIYWVYEAVYVQGYHENAKLTNELVEKARGSRRSNVSISTRERHELLHSDLFLGVFGKAVSFCLDNVGQVFDLHIITDNVDKKIMKMFEDEAAEFLNVGKPSEHEVKGFDKSTGQVITGAIRIEWIDSGNSLGDFSGVTYSIECEDSELTLAADVISNSVNYYIKKSVGEGVGIDLNTKVTVADHPLSSLIYGASEGGETPYFSDAIYQHPAGNKEL